MITQTDPEQQAASPHGWSARARRERSVLWVYLWLLVASLFMVPWMSLGINRLETLYQQATRPWTGSEPAWSPDGQSIAFVSTRWGGETIYIMNADGTHPRRLLPPSSSYAIDYDPDWAPDGHQIAYSSNRTGNFEIYVADLATGAARQLTNNAAHDENPSWSPDSRNLAFWSDRAGNEDIYVMDANGGSVHRLTTDPANDTWPDWSPDGNYLAFNSNRSGNDDLYVMDREGGDVRRLTYDEADEVWPRWSPDGKALVFESAARGDLWISILRLEEGSVRMAHEGVSPAWSPVGDRIAYATGSMVAVMAPDGSGVVSLTARTTEEMLSTPPISVGVYAATVALPGVLLLALLIPLGSRLVYVRRHAQQAVFFAVLRVVSTVLIVGLSRGQLIALWVIVNGGLWLFGGVWGLRQVRRGDCWLMRVRGEVSDLPRAWATRPMVTAPVTLASQASSDAITEEEGREATIERLRQMLRAGSAQERKWAIESLEALGEIEEF